MRVRVSDGVCRHQSTCWKRRSGTLRRSATTVEGVSMDEHAEQKECTWECMWKSICVTNTDVEWWLEQADSQSNKPCDCGDDRIVLEVQSSIPQWARVHLRADWSAAESTAWKTLERSATAMTTMTSSAAVLTISNKVICFYNRTDLSNIDRQKLCSLCKEAQWHEACKKGVNLKSFEQKCVKNHVFCLSLTWTKLAMSIFQQIKCSLIFSAAHDLDARSRLTHLQLSAEATACPCWFWWL